MLNSKYMKKISVKILSCIVLVSFFLSFVLTGFTDAMKINNIKGDINGDINNKANVIYVSSSYLNENSGNDTQKTIEQNKIKEFTDNLIFHINNDLIWSNEKDKPIIYYEDNIKPGNLKSNINNINNHYNNTNIEKAISIDFNMDNSTDSGFKFLYPIENDENVNKERKEKADLLTNVIKPYYDQLDVSSKENQEERSNEFLNEIKPESYIAYIASINNERDMEVLKNKENINFLSAGYALSILKNLELDGKYTIKENLGKLYNLSKETTIEQLPANEINDTNPVNQTVSANEINDTNSVNQTVSANEINDTNSVNQTVSANEINDTNSVNQTVSANEINDTNSVNQTVSANEINDTNSVNQTVSANEINDTNSVNQTVSANEINDTNSVNQTVSANEINDTNSVNQTVSANEINNTNSVNQTVSANEINNTNSVNQTVSANEINDTNSVNQTVSANEINDTNSVNQTVSANEINDTNSVNQTVSANEINDTNSANQTVSANEINDTNSVNQTVSANEINDTNSVNQTVSANEINDTNSVNQTVSANEINDTNSVNQTVSANEINDTNSVNQTVSANEINDTNSVNQTVSANEINDTNSVNQTVSANEINDTNSVCNCENLDNLDIIQSTAIRELNNLDDQNNKLLLNLIDKEKYVPISNIHDKTHNIPLCYFKKDEIQDLKSYVLDIFLIMRDSNFKSFPNEISPGKGIDADTKDEIGYLIGNIIIKLVELTEIKEPSYPSSATVAQEAAVNAVANSYLINFLRYYDHYNPSKKYLPFQVIMNIFAQTKINVYIKSTLDDEGRYNAIKNFIKDFHPAAKTTIDYLGLNGIIDSPYTEEAFKIIISNVITSAVTSFYRRLGSFGILIEAALIGFGLYEEAYAFISDINKYTREYREESMNKIIVNKLSPKSVAKSILTKLEINYNYAKTSFNAGLYAAISYVFDFKINKQVPIDVMNIFVAVDAAVFNSIVNHYSYNFFNRIQSIAVSLVSTAAMWKLSGITIAVLGLKGSMLLTYGATGVLALLIHGGMYVVQSYLFDACDPLSYVNNNLIDNLSADDNGLNSISNDNIFNTTSNDNIFNTTFNDNIFNTTFNDDNKSMPYNDERKNLNQI